MRRVRSCALAPFGNLPRAVMTTRNAGLPRVCPGPSTPAPPRAPPLRPLNGMHQQSALPTWPPSMLRCFTKTLRPLRKGATASPNRSAASRKAPLSSRPYSRREPSTRACHATTTQFSRHDASQCEGRSSSSR
jgi:hypothetical protein